MKLRTSLFAFAAVVSSSALFAQEPVVGKADESLFTTIEAEVDVTPDRQVIRVPHPINHPKFGAAALSAFHEISGRAS